MHRKGATDPSRIQPLVYSPCTRLPLFLGAAQVYDLGADGEAVRFVTSLDAPDPFLDLLSEHGVAWEWAEYHDKAPVTSVTSEV